MQTFGDGFDCYAAVTDPLLGYWDGGSISTANGQSLVAGRFAGSQAVSSGAGASMTCLIKSSGANDAVHHIVCAFRQTAALSGTNAGLNFQLSDGATNQCCIVFRSDGAILLTSATATGTTLDTYTGAVSATNTWFAFEFEVVINNTTGSWAVRKNGNTSNDHALGSLNTRPGTNNYANKLSINLQNNVNAQQLDDLLWRSDPSSVPWVGDVRCYTRMPASDAQAQFSKSPASVAITPQTAATTISIGAGTARYTSFVATYDGTVGSLTLSLGVGYTGNMKCSIFANAAGLPTSVLGSATTLVNPIAGNNTFTFPTPVAVAKNATYWIGFDSDTSSGTYSVTAGNVGVQSLTTYASFPVASPGGAGGGQAPIITVTLTLNSYSTVNEAQQDGTTSYIYDSNVGDNDLYGIASIAITPASTVCVTTRGFAEKSDAGTRGAAVQLKSGTTTVQSTATALATSWGWLFRTDLVDPATGAAWTAAAVSAAQIGAKVTS